MDIFKYLKLIASNDLEELKRAVDKINKNKRQFDWAQAQGLGRYTSQQREIIERYEYLLKKKRNDKRKVVIIILLLLGFLIYFQFNK